MLAIPEKFNKNAPDVRAIGTSAETGAWLIQYMCERLGVLDLGELDTLDLGCGCRFIDAIVNGNLPVKSYTGIDVDHELIRFLNDHIDERRFKFHHWNAYNPAYNPTGTSITADSLLPTGEETFDLIVMYSVITHQLPKDTEMLLRLLRCCIRPKGHIFFSADLREIDQGYQEMVPERPTAHSAYSLEFLKEIAARSGWRLLSVAGKAPRGSLPNQDTLLCEPA
ncbi:MAG: class I SAM-dependent methyltransferase [Candidatus Binataceae bacterium]